MSKKYKFKGETIFNYVPEYSPSVDVDALVFVKLPADKKDNKLKDIERDLHGYWELLHPMVKEYIIGIVKHLNELVLEVENVTYLRRSLDLELENSSRSSDENRQLKAQLSDLLMEKQALQEKVKDLLGDKPAIRPEEFQALKLLTSSKYDVQNDKLESLIEKAVQEARESEEIAKARQEKEKAMKELEDGKKHFEKTQKEVGEAFQMKIISLQQQISELEQELAEHKK